ncbi:MAG: helix-turn-helix domain-containing protein [Firmicutes bacterium]|nr:helix-turn-helix domain-containing protein [Bacillota bacterium]
MTFGEKLKLLRLEKKLTTRQLGELVNSTSSMISKWEQNLCEPKIATLRKIAAVFNISIEELTNNEIDI